MTDIGKLKEHLNKLPPYPKNMKEVNVEIKGRAFFPGGRGTYGSDELISNKEIMVLGQDFDTKKKFDSAKANGGEDTTKNKTWKNLLSLLGQAKIQPENCFFTNAIMGIRLTERATGESPAFKDKEFIKKCQDFFLLQLKVQKPRTILVLGSQVTKFLVDTSPDLVDLKRMNKFKIIDNEKKQIIRNVKFNNEITANLIFLMHPSARAHNITSRHYLKYYGMDAQIKMVQDAIN